MRTETKSEQLQKLVTLSQINLYRTDKGGAPRLGQDTDAVLTKLLEYTPAEIEVLKGRGIID